MLKTNDFFQISLILITSSILTACGGSSDNDTYSSSEINENTSAGSAIASINANDISTLVYENQVSAVSVLGAVATDNVAQTKLTAVTPVTEDKTGCTLVNSSIDADKLTFEVKSSDEQYCLYKYQVTNTQTQETSEAIAQVGVVSSETTLLTTSQLEPLSEVVQTADSINIDLDISSGEFLIASNVVLIGSGSISVDESAGVISYTSAEEGNYRIYYSLVNSDQTLVQTGTIDIAVADTLNYGTEADNFKYVTTADAASGLNYTVINAGDMVTIDVGAHISDPDLEDELTLTSVKSYNASTQIVADEQFTFSATTEGFYYVTYIVEDGNGSYAVGIVEVKVGSPWNDVLVSSISKLFLAPITYDAAVEARLSFSGIASELSGANGNGVANVPTYSYDEASIICQAKGGFLPSQAELIAFKEQEENPFKIGDGISSEMAADWPIQKAYFSHTEYDTDPDMVYAYNASTGVIELVDKSSYQYLMCVEGSSIELSIDSNFYLTLNEENPLSLSYAINGESVSDYTEATLWQQGSITDSSHTPELNSSDVEIDDNKITPSNTGWINISASSQVDNLSADRDYLVTSNILNVEGADPTFDTDMITTASSCLETTVTYPDTLSSGFNPTGTSGTVTNISNCSDSYTGDATNTYYKFSPTDGLPDARLMLNSDKNIVLGKGNYTLSFWSKFVLTAPKQITMEASLYLDDDADNLITCSIDNAGNMGGTNASLVDFYNDWNKVSCDVSITTQGTYAFRLLARDNYTNGTISYVYADEPELLPKR